MAAPPFVLPMTTSIVVFTDFPAAAEWARSYAAVLAVCLGAQVHLLHVYPPAPEAARVGTGIPTRDVSKNRRLLVQVAADRPGSATAGHTICSMTIPLNRYFGTPIFPFCYFRPRWAL